MFIIHHAVRLSLVYSQALNTKSITTRCSLPFCYTLIPRRIVCTSRLLLHKRFEPSFLLNNVDCCSFAASGSSLLKTYFQSKLRLLSFYKLVKNCVPQLTSKFQGLTLFGSPVIPKSLHVVPYCLTIL